MRTDDVVEITCYSTTRQYKRQDAVNHFLECMMCSEGAERDRYTNIYLDLLAGKKIIKH